LDGEWMFSFVVDQYCGASITPFTSATRMQTSPQCGIVASLTAMRKKISFFCAKSTLPI
jgi:hypothetical protein